MPGDRKARRKPVSSELGLLPHDVPVRRGRVYLHIQRPASRHDQVPPRVRRQTGGAEMKIRLEFKPRDLWIGAFLEKEHLWICAVPCFPIHFDWSENGVAEGIIGKQLSNTESNSNKEVRMPDEKK